MFKKTGATEIEVVIIILDQIEPILYAAKMAIGPKQLTEAEKRNTARRELQSNPRLTSSEIGRAIGRSRQAVDKYIADLRATAVFELELKIFRLHQLGIPQNSIAKRVGLGLGSGTGMGHPAGFQYQGKAGPDHLRSPLF